MTRMLESPFLDLDCFRRGTTTKPSLLKVSSAKEKNDTDLTQGSFSDAEALWLPSLKLAA